MDVVIKKGEIENLEDCYEALINSEIGEAYFESFDARKILLSGLKNKEIDVAIDILGKCVGFIWYERYGTFGIHTYLHIIAVRQEFRGKGIGKKLIKQFEENIFKKDSMIFLMVADFNKDAKKLYEKIGYEQVGIIPSFYRKGINEHLMMKTKPVQ
ncbi:GNAT family N-acetyltransferase [Clostridium folliculivorans]|uniref:N-acetyltransferase domain-containing protein n=1 Tax=Clostridium folliculivorans TaxID=2886038 RepID=A0A9W5Y1J7_9CLOT|nr:N-acetyltransferase [Clostridium folliculivorans]GKU24925.1 hypothetical protein CFOLD11_17510 [Clostridium folliculivorans]GKU31023.1 hypothetical protein CFB3_31300 [Clostridium folliculivorans]